jgi:hypothetical protein
VNCLKPIKDIVVGDIVDTYDTNCEQPMYGRVTAVFVNPNPLSQVVLAEISGIEVVVTIDHKIWYDKQWVTVERASNLYPEGVKILKLLPPQVVYDLQVTRNHNYYITNGVYSQLVHNSGKTHIGTELLIEDVETYGKDVMYIAPTQTMAREIVIPTLKKALRGQKGWEFKGATNHFIYRPAEASLLIKGADRGEDALRGGAKRLIVCDEFAFWKKPESLLKEILIPQLSDYNGKMIYISTPKGRNHMYKLKNRALNDPTNFFTCHCTMFENTFTSEIGKQQAVAEYDGETDPLYRQEMLAEYIDFKGLVFTVDWTKVMCDWQPYEYDRCEYHLGIDLGFNDPTACVALAYNPMRNEYCIYATYSKNSSLLAEHIEHITQLIPYPIKTAVGDNHLQTLAEMNHILKQKGKLWAIHPVKKSSKAETKTGELLSMVNAFNYGRLKIHDSCKHIIDEFASYEWEQDGNDHLIDASRYVWINHVRLDEMVEAESSKKKLDDRADLRKTAMDYEGGIDGVERIGYDWD